MVVHIIEMLTRAIEMIASQQLLRHSKVAVRGLRADLDWRSRTRSGDMAEFLELPLGSHVIRRYIARTRYQMSIRDVRLLLPRNETLVYYLLQL